MLKIDRNAGLSLKRAAQRGRVQLRRDQDQCGQYRHHHQSQGAVEGQWAIQRVHWIPHISYNHSLMSVSLIAVSASDNYFQEARIVLTNRIRALQQWIASLEAELHAPQITTDSRALEQALASIERLLDAVEALFDQQRRDQQPTS